MAVYVFVCQLTIASQEAPFQMTSLQQKIAWENGQASMWHRIQRCLPATFVVRWRCCYLQIPNFVLATAVICNFCRLSETYSRNVCLYLAILCEKASSQTFYVRQQDIKNCVLFTISQYAAGHIIGRLRLIHHQLQQQLLRLMATVDLHYRTNTSKLVVYKVANAVIRVLVWKTVKKPMWSKINDKYIV